MEVNAEYFWKDSGLWRGPGEVVAQVALASRLHSTKQIYYEGTTAWSFPKLFSLSTKNIRTYSIVPLEMSILLTSSILYTEYVSTNCHRAYLVLIPDVTVEMPSLNSKFSSPVAFLILSRVPASAQMRIALIQSPTEERNTKASIEAGTVSERKPGTVPLLLAPQYEQIKQQSYIRFFFFWCGLGRDGYTFS